MSRRGQPAPPRGMITTQLMSRAEAGDVDALWEIDTAVRNPSNCTAGVVMIALKHLELELVPNIAEKQHEEDRYRENGRRALACLTILSSVFPAFKSKSGLRASVSFAMQSSVDGLCMWINHMLHFGLSIDMDTTPGTDFRKPYFYHAQLLCDLIDSDPLVFVSLLSGTRFFDLLIRIWMTEGKRGEVFMNITSADPCPILMLVLKVLKNEAGRDMLLRRTLARPHQFRYDFVGRVVLRATQVTRVGVSSQKAVGYVDGIFSVAEILLSDQEPLDLRRSFVEEGYLKEFATVLNQISLDAEESGQVNSIMRAIVRPTYKLFGLIMSQNRRAPRNYRDLISGDIFRHLTRLMGWLPKNDKASADVCVPLLKMLGMYTIYPNVIEAFKPRGKLPPDLPKKLYERPFIAPVWDDFRAALRDRMEAHATMLQGQLTICDNFSCDVLARLKRSVPVESKKCSGCSYVVYCSEKCQKQDWAERHRAECTHARRYHRTRRSNQTWYSHSTRAFHAHFIASTFNTCWEQMQRECKELYPTIPFHQILPVMQCTSIRFAVNLEPIVPIPKTNPNYEVKDIETAWWERGDNIEFKQGWLKQRVSVLVEGYRDGKIGKDNVRVAEGAFPMGNDAVVFLTIKLVKNTNGRWEPASSVARYATKVVKSSK